MAQKADGTVYINSLMDTSGFKAGGKQMESAARRMAKSVSDIQSKATSGINSIGNSVKKLAGLLAVTFSVKQLTQFGKEAIELGSALSEVQNVVDVTFGDISGEINDFAKNAITQFGLSETAAKQYTSTMGAMLKSMGLTTREAADMSMSMTGLAADMASFYNLDAEEAFYKIRAGISGETEPLKQLGINMSVANLEAFALAKGINKSYNAMTQQEQAVLRYNYLLSVTADAQGDFARTSESWANQTRVLSEQFKAIKATIGQGLINVFTPVLKVINTLLAKLATLANAFKSFTELITGKKSSGSTGGAAAGLGGGASTSDMADGYNQAADSAENFAGATEDAADATKKAEKAAKGYLSPLDEINKFQTDAEDLSDALTPDTSGGQDVGDQLSDAIGNVDYGKIAEGETVLDDFSKKLKDIFESNDWEALGAYMADGINKGLQKVYDVINWDNVGPKIVPFINAFTKTFNSLVDNIDWDLFGRTLGAGINTVVNTLNLLIEGIDWVNLGKKLAVGVNGLVDEVDWKNLGRLIGNKFMILPEIALGFVKELDWSGIGTAIGDSLNGVVSTIDLSLIGELLGIALKGLFQAAINFAATFDWKALGTNIYRGINTFFSTTDWATVGTGISDLVKGLLDTIIVTVEGIDWTQVGESVATMLANIDWAGIAERLFELLGAALGGLGAVMVGLFRDAVKSVKEFMEEKIQEWVDMGGDVTTGFLYGIGAGLVEIAKWIKEHIFDPFIKGFKKAFGINSPSTVMAEQGGYVISGLLKGLEDKISSVLDWVAKIPGWIKEKLGDASQWLLEKGRKALAGLKTGFAEKWSAFTEFLGEKKKAIVDKFKDLKDKMLVKGRNIINGLKSGASEKWSTLSSFLIEKKEAIVSKFSNIRDSMANVGRNIINGIIDGLSSAWNSLVSWAQSIFDLFSFNIGGGGGYSSGGVVQVINSMPTTPVFPVPDIPYLAKGAVIPPNAPFAAILGDQRRGTNLELPEDLLRKIIREETGRNQQNQKGRPIERLTIMLNRKVVFDEMIDEAVTRQTVYGRNPFELG